MIDVRVTLFSSPLIYVALLWPFLKFLQGDQIELRSKKIREYRLGLLASAVGWPCEAPRGFSSCTLGGGRPFYTTATISPSSLR